MNFPAVLAIFSLLAPGVGANTSIPGPDFLERSTQFASVFEQLDGVGLSVATPSKPAVELPIPEAVGLIIEFEDGPGVGAFSSESDDLNRFLIFWSLNSEARSDCKLKCL